MTCLYIVADRLALLQKQKEALEAEIRHTEEACLHCLYGHSRGTCGLDIEEECPTAVFLTELGQEVIVTSKEGAPIER